MQVDTSQYVAARLRGELGVRARSTAEQQVARAERLGDRPRAQLWREVAVNLRDRRNFIGRHLDLKL